MKNQANINVGQSIRSAVAGEEIVITGFNEFFVKGYLVGSSCLAGGNERCGWKGFCIVSYKNILE